MAQEIGKKFCDSKEWQGGKVKAIAPLLEQPSFYANAFYLMRRYSIL